MNIEPTATHTVSAHGHWILRGYNSRMGSLLLVHPTEDPERYRVGIRRGRLWDINLGLVFLATYLEQNGWKFQKAIQITESEFASICKGAIVGISSQQNNYRQGIRLAKLAKSSDARLVVLGGPYASSRAEQIVRHQPDVDCVVSGPGERALSHILAGVPMDTIPGLTYRAPNGQLVTIQRDALPLDERPVPDRSLWPALRTELAGKPATLAYWQDGCPIALNHACVFCTIQHAWKPSRRTVEQVIAEMEILAEMGYAGVEDGGDDFAMGGQKTIDWLSRLADAMKERGLDFSWLIHSSARSLTTPNPGMMQALRKVGVRVLQIGFESGDPDLKVCMKTSRERETILLQQAADLGIKIYGAWIFGMPGETPESLQMTLAEARNLYQKGLMAGVMIDPLWPGPGCKAFDDICVDHPEWAESDFVEPEDLMHAWFNKRTSVKLDQVLAERSRFIEGLDVDIVGGMLL